MKIEADRLTLHDAYSAAKAEWLMASDGPGADAEFDAMIRVLDAADDLIRWYA